VLLARVAAGAADAPAAAVTLPADAKPGQVVEIALPGGVPMKFCYCPPGEFRMGLPQTKKEKEQGVGGQVPVRITKGFWLAQTEFTQAQRTALKLENRGRVEPPGAKPDHPAWCNGYWIGAHDERSAVGTIAKLSAAVPLPAGWRFSLPTEAQWEYACRAGTETFFHFGDALDGTQANCNGEYPHGVATKGPNLGDVCPVASYPPNAWGLYDMHGNAAEWCLDFYAPTLEGGDDPTGPAAATNPERPERVTRGGGFGSRAVYCGSGARKNSHLGYHANGMGFRVAIVPGDAPPAAEQ
jgi:formylglycine-generating enzyme required for sulfatase activity